MRQDGLFLSAKSGGQIAYRILQGEGWVRSQVLIEFETDADKTSVQGRSSELIFSLAAITGVLAAINPSLVFPEIAATGTLTEDGRVGEVSHLSAKLAAAIDAFSAPADGVIFYPRSSPASAVSDSVLHEAAMKGATLCPVDALDEALEYLGVVLQRVYLREPFRGLEHFGYEHRAIFFGREAETRALSEKLLRREAAGSPGALIVGASGAGKSSFLHAGVLPALAEPAFIQLEAIRSRPAQGVDRKHRGCVGDVVWRPSSVLPTIDEQSIANTIWRNWSCLPEFQSSDFDEVVSSLGQLEDKLVSSWPKQRRFVWTIDQLEEVFTGGYAPDSVSRLARFIRRLQELGAWVLATIREDFVAQLDASSELANLFSRIDGRFYLPILGGSALGDVIQRPAEMAGLSFARDRHGVSLAKILQDEAIGEAEPLPLLEFALAELYRSRENGVLTYDAYLQMGGLRGAVASRADQALDGIERSRRPALLRALGRLVVVGSDKQAAQGARMARARAQFGDFSGVEREQLDHFVAARLLVKAGDSEGSETTIELAHEALLHSWPPLKEWIHQHRDLLAWRQEVLLPLMRIWDVNNRASGRLLPRSLLKASPAGRASAALGVLTDRESEFLTLSEAWQGKRWLMGAGVTASLAAIALALPTQLWRPGPKGPRPTFSVAVLPFSSSDGSATGTRLASALTQAATSKLKSSAHYLTIPSYNLVTKYEGTPLDARSVGRDLNVRYLIEGALQQSGQTYDARVQLVDAENGAQIWSEEFNARSEQVGDGDGPFVWNLVMKIRNALGAAEQRRTAGPLPPDASPMDIVLHAATIEDRTRDVLPALAEQRKLYDQALERDPNLVLALVAKGYALGRELDWNPRGDHDRLVQEFEDASFRAVLVDDKDPRAWGTRARALTLQHRWEAALEANDKSLALDQSPVPALAQRALILFYLGQPAEALEVLDQASARDIPNSRWEGWILFTRCRAHFALGHYDDAIALCQRSIAQGDWWMVHAYLAAGFGQKGDLKSAAAEKAILEEFLPNFSIGDFKRARLSDAAAYSVQTEAHLYAGLRKAGVPD